MEEAPVLGDGAGAASTPAVTDSAGLVLRLDALEKRLDDRDAELRREWKSLRDTVSRAAAQDRRAAPSLPSTTEAAARNAEKMGGGAGASSQPEVDPALLADKVAAQVEKRMSDREARIAGRELSEDGRWKAPLAELAEELSLDADAKEKARVVFDATKDRSFALLKVQRLDGGSLLDDYCEALKANPDAAADSTRELFRRIVNERVPGTDQTYLAGFIEVGVDTDRELAKNLDRPTMARLRGLRLDMLDVKTGYDPVGDYVRARVQ